MFFFYFDQNQITVGKFISISLINIKSLLYLL